MDQTKTELLAEVDKALSEAIHELVVSTDQPREVHVSRLTALMDRRIALTRPPIYARVEELLRKRI
jgi:hypothetical protein